MDLFAKLFVIYISVVATKSLETCANLALKPESVNRELTTHALAIHYNYQTIDKCAFRCMVTHGCLSMSYHRKEETCLLHRVDSSSVVTDDFLTVEGSVHSDLAEWPMRGVCRNHTCADDEQCFPTGNRYVCKIASAELCLQNPTSLSCYKRYADKDLYGYDLHSDVVNGTVEKCVMFCNTAHPTFKSFLYVTYSNRCICKSMSVWTFLKGGNSMETVFGASTYERLL